VSEEDDGDGKQRCGQTIRREQEKLQKASASLLTMIEGHGDALPAPRPFPEGEDDRQRE
jgi:hypothetical protein